MKPTIFNVSSIITTLVISISLLGCSVKEQQAESVSVIGKVHMIQGDSIMIVTVGVDTLRMNCQLIDSANSEIPIVQDSVAICYKEDEGNKYVRKVIVLDHNLPINNVEAMLIGDWKVAGKDCIYRFDENQLMLHDGSDDCHNYKWTIECDTLMMCVNDGSEKSNNQNISTYTIRRIDADTLILCDSEDRREVCLTRNR